MARGRTSVIFLLPTVTRSIRPRWVLGILLVENEVAEAVGNPMVVVFFQGLHHVRVAADNQVRACVDHLVGKFHLLVGRAQSVLHAPVRAHDHQVRQGPRKTDVRERLRGVQPRYARAIHARRCFLGIDVHIGEKGDPQATHAHQQRVMGRQNILPGAHGLDARRTQPLHAIEQRLRAPVVSVIIGLRSHVETCGFQSFDYPWIGAKGIEMMQVATAV